MSLRTLRLARTIDARRMLCTSTLGASGTLRVRGVDLFYLTNGRETEMPLLCMPGAMGTAETDFAPQFQLTGLSDTTQVISFDPSGYGHSGQPRVSRLQTRRQPEWRAASAQRRVGRCHPLCARQPADILWNWIPILLHTSQL